MMKRVLMGVALAALMLAATGCRQWMDELDVVGNGSIAALGAALDAVPGGAERDESGGWALAAPDGSARFLWGGDRGAMLELEAKPFLDAGLNPSALPDGIALSGTWLTVGSGLGGGDADPAPLAAYERIVRLHGDRVGYHMAMDHYNLDLGGGNLFEWAKDMAANDKDIVFVLDPAPFIAAGVDPGAVAGWTFAKVPVHAGGRQVEVDKLLKPFNLR